MGAGWRTLAYTLIVVALEFTFGLAVALLFTALGSRSAVWRTVFMYPLMIAPVVAGLLWRFLLIDNFGLLNELLHQAGHPAQPGPDRLAVAIRRSCCSRWPCRTSG